MTEPLFLKPYFQPKIWGGQKLRTDFGYDIPKDEKIGECWAISAHPHGQSIIENGPLAGEPLATAWQDHKEYFGNAKEDVFPLLTKILDAEASLSVQVHPDDAYAEEHEHELGKTECWYIISAEPGAYLIYGHTAKTKAELRDMIEKEEWDTLLRKVPVKTGDFFYVPSGTIHALNKGIMALETQQSSDTTYRLYDYDRKDDQGNKRELHIAQSLDVTTVPHVDPKLDIEVEKVGNSKLISYVKPPMSPFFSVWQWQIEGSLEMKREKGLYTLVSVLNGTGTITCDGQMYDLKKGMHFIIPNQIKDWKIAGKMQIIASEPVEH